MLPVSARTGDGLDALRAELATRVRARRAATDRLTADVRTAATALAPHCGTGRDVAKAERATLTAALAGAAGVPAVVAAVERSARKAGAARTGWPLVRWTGKLRPDPLGRLHLGGGEGAGRTSLPPASSAQRAAVSTALRRARDSAGEGLPQAWRDDLRRTVEVSEGRLTDRLDRAVAAADLGPDRVPGWQRAVAGLQWLLVLLALAGALWLLGLVGLAYLQLDDVLPLPRVQRIPLPTLLLVGGLLAGLLLAVVTRPLVRAGARRRARRAERRLHEQVAAVAEDEVLAPLATAREDHDRFCAAVTRARS